MKKIFASLICLLILIPLTSSAAVNTMEELQAQINSLLAMVAKLQSQLATQNGNSGGSCYTFNNDLKIGDQKEDVSFLLNALTRSGVAGERSSNFSNTFDEVLASYVSAFQEKYRSEILTPAGLSNGTGYLGARTRAKLNALYGCGVIENQNEPLTVLYPNGGEVWTLGTTQTIKWVPLKSPASTAQVTVSLIDSNGDGYERWLGNAKNQDSSFTWYIPNCTTNNPCSSNFQIVPGKYKIRVSGPGSSDVSNQALTIVNANPTSIAVPSVSVTSPNGGEKFIQGDNMPITWKNTNYRNSVVNVYLYKGSYSGDYNYVARIGDVAQTNDGIETWTIPTSVPAGDNYFVRVNLDVKDPEGGYDMSDDSDMPFSIYPSPSSVNTITSGLCPHISKAWGETFVDVDAGSIYMGGRNYVVNGSTGVTAGANKTVNFYAYVPSGQSTGYIGVANPNTPEAYNFESMGVLVATIQSGSNPTDSTSSYGGVIQNIDSKAPKCPGYTRTTQIPTKPDLTVVSTSCNLGNSPDTYKKISCEITVFNNSAVDITKNFDVNIQGTAVTVYAPFKAWEKRVVKSPTTFGLTILGTYELNFPVDIWGSIDESNEGNNNGVLNFNVPINS